MLWGFGVSSNQAHSGFRVLRPRNTFTISSQGLGFRVKHLEAELFDFLEAALQLDSFPESSFYR